MVAKHAGRHGRSWRRIRAQVLAASTICWLCGHDGSDSADHLIARSLCLAMGWEHLLEDPSNLRPAHHKPCPVCGKRCNTERGTGQRRRKTVTASRNW